SSGESELPEGDTFYAAMGKCGRSWRHLQWASVLRAYIHPPKQRGSSSSPAATDCSEHPDGKWEDHRARNTLELRQRHVYGCFDVRIEEPGAAGPMEVDAPGPAQDDVGTSRGSSVKANSSGLLIMADWVVSQISEMRPAVLHKAAALYHLLNEIDLPLGPEPPPVREACPLCGAGVRFQAWGHGTCEPCPAQAAASPGGDGAAVRPASHDNGAGGAGHRLPRSAMTLRVDAGSRGWRWAPSFGIRNVC
ncbi:hypothetical protein CYMTET_12026, partial [Cymbomonas tetramitiformis]